MNIKNCRKCGRMFQTLSDERICKECKGRLEEKFQEVKEYIQENRQATLQEISHACDVTVKQIEQWVREERLEFSPESTDIFTCEQCGAPIRTGRLCPKCKDKMVNNLEGLYKTVVEPTKKKTDGNKMRFSRGLE